MFWKPWRAPRKPSISRPPLPGIKKPINGKKHPYRCKGGPFDGELIALSDGNSAVFQVPRGKHGAITRGRYECAIVAVRYQPGETVWRAR